MILADTFDPKASGTVDWKNVPVGLLAAEAANGDKDAIAEVARRSGISRKRSRPALAVEAKGAVHEGFEESKHPRDKHGRFISIGAHVDLGGGKVGEVLSATHGAITVRRDDGKTETIKGDGLRSVAVTHARTPDGGATPVSRTPVRPYAERLPRIGDVVVLNDGREGEVRHIYADGRSIKFSFVERDGSITREKVDKGTVAKITSAAPEPLAPGELPVGRMPGAMSNAQLESVPAKRSQIAALRRELDAQGVRADHPIRGVLLDAGGDYVAVARDPEGKIVGGASYSISRIGRRIDIRLMHVINQRQGIGQDLIRHIAMQSAGLPGSGQYEMSVYGAIMTAKPFYQRTGAHGDSHSGLMTWDPDTVNRLKAGDPMTPGTLDGKPYRRGKARPYLRLGDTLPPVQMTAQEMLQALIEGKHDGRFDPAKHPRDKHGRFAHIGDLVKLADGKHGRITAVGAGGKLTVRKESGGSVTVDSKKVAKVTGEASGATDARGAARALRLLPKQGRKEGTGTLDDPIAVGADIERAAHLLAEGKHVRLDQPDQVVTLVDKLRAMVADAKSRGEKAPTFDLGKVTVPGTNLFTQESKGIPRINMPQFRGVPAPGSPAEAFRGSGGESGANIEQPFRDALAAMGIPTRHATVPASHLRASQVELDGAKTAGIASGMAAGKVKDVPIFVTRDNYIIDGHHRWAAKIVHGLSGGDASMPVEVVDLDIGAALDYANAFAKVMGIASQAIDDPGSGRAPVAAATKVIYVSSVLPSDFREQMTKVLAEDAVTPSVRRRAFLAVKDIAPSAALLDGEGSGEEVPVEAAVAASPVPPRRSRIADHLAAVYAQTPRHHVVRAIDAAYARAGDPPAEDAKEA